MSESNGVSIENPVKWLAFYLRPRHEKKASERLAQQGYEIYCPLIKTKVRWSDRWKKVQKPALPGYIFARVDEKGRRKILEDESVFNSVFWNKKPAVIRDEEIRAMKFLLEEAENADTEKLEEVHPGDKVKLESGQLAGFDGIVVTVANKTVRLKISGLDTEFVVTVPLGRIKIQTQR